MPATSTSGTGAYFVTCRDAGKTALLLGPFTTESACKDFAQFTEDNPKSRLSEVIRAVCEIDRKAHFFAYGMIKINGVKPEENFQGILNKMNPEKWNVVLS